jgi:hypothetical protein
MKRNLNMFCALATVILLLTPPVAKAEENCPGGWAIDLVDLANGCAAFYTNGVNIHVPMQGTVGSGNVDSGSGTNLLSQFLTAQLCRAMLTNSSGSSLGLPPGMVVISPKTSECKKPWYTRLANAIGEIISGGPGSIPGKADIDSSGNIHITWPSYLPLPPATNRYSTNIIWQIKSLGETWSANDTDGISAQQPQSVFVPLVWPSLETLQQSNNGEFPNSVTWEVQFRWVPADVTNDYGLLCDAGYITNVSCSIYSMTWDTNWDAGQQPLVDTNIFYPTEPWYVRTNVFVLHSTADLDFWGVYSATYTNGTWDADTLIHEANMSSGGPQYFTNTANADCFWVHALYKTNDDAVLKSGTLWELFATSDSTNGVNRLVCGAPTMRREDACELYGGYSFDTVATGIKFERASGQLTNLVTEVVYVEWSGNYGDAVVWTDTDCAAVRAPVVSNNVWRTVLPANEFLWFKVYACDGPYDEDPTLLFSAETNSSSPICVTNYGHGKYLIEAGFPIATGEEFIDSTTNTPLWSVELQTEHTSLATINNGRWPVAAITADWPDQVIVTYSEEAEAATAKWFIETYRDNYGVDVRKVEACGFTNYGESR